MATVQRPAEDSSSGANEGRGTASGGQDAFFVQAHVYKPEAKLPESVSFARALNKYAASSGVEKKQARAFVTALDEQRKALETALGSATALEETAFDEILNTYLSLLLGLIDRQPAADATSSADDVEAALNKMDSEAGGSNAAVAAAGGALAGSSPLRHLVPFAWQEAVAVKGRAAGGDALFELASVLVAAGLWRMQRAAHLLTPSVKGASTEASAQVGGRWWAMGCAPPGGRCRLPNGYAGVDVQHSARALHFHTFSLSAT
jgi:hypothetical protein